VIAKPSSEAARLMAPMALRDALYRPLVLACEAFEFQPIVTVYLLYRDPPTWPSRMLALESAPHVEHYGQWAFDRSERLVDGPLESRPAAGKGLVAVVISAEGGHREIDNDELLAAVARQMATQCGMPSRPLDTRIIIEKRATYASTPALHRPDVTTPHPRLALAGDYVSDPDPLTDYPATLEAAVIAGNRAADALLRVLTS
jgi:hydroxysqualene dehydroxylase